MTNRAVGRVLRPLDRIASAAQAIAEGTGRPAMTPRGTSLVPVDSSFDRTARPGDAGHPDARFAADVGHELRSR